MIVCSQTGDSLIIFAASVMSVDLGETTEEDKLQLFFVNNLFILSGIIISSSVSPRHSVTGWQKAFDPRMRFAMVELS